MKKTGIMAILLAAVWFGGMGCHAQGMQQPNRPAKVRPSHQMRLIIDNDYAGDPDGMFQLVHHLLSPSVDIRYIIGSHLRVGDVFDSTNQTADNAKKHIEAILEMMGMTGKYPVLAGSNIGLSDPETPLHSEAAKAIVKEAMRDDMDLPLYVVCGGGLTEIASAYLMEPRIADRLTLVWIGGMEYTDVALPPPGYARTEYNTAIDINAVKVIFNKSDIKLWQIPRNVYRQALVTKAELNLRVKPYSAVGAKITDMIEHILNRMAREAYILGDNPLVLVTALLSIFEADATSSPYQLRQAPFINDEGMYEINREGRIIKVFNQIDNRLMFEDMFAKMQLLQSQ
ncbi:purine nucleosidase [Parabacteroides sp. PFB2-12]|uniref:nucleoside hydrolase n=1 Tax=unclassified Parabacteroides TaxID=2649774 RepID=UPI0024749562|nr:MULTISPECIES: nucleoside hydrolase [unclassified Parabacteroides]MDH6343505.1 purine nucleosidase [Parabacteroides sp. PM6-13]MDH6390895.1 purine nucleosidase [Parabacteroides sp. PFB2-12]